MNYAIRYAAPFLAMAALGMLAAPAHATFTTESCSNGGCPGDLKFYDSHDNHDVTGFVGSVGAESGGLPDTVDTFVDTNTAAGYATIKETTADTLDELLFTPGNPLAFDDFSFRGQIDRQGFSDALTIIVTGCLDVGGVCQMEAPQTINVTTDAGAEADFGRLAIHSTDGETIYSVAVETASGAFFKEFKQVDFSLAPGVTGPVPEPASWAMMLVGFGGLGATMRVRRRQRAA
jgi:hypothetical protein